MAKPDFHILSNTELYSNSLTPLKVSALSSTDYSSNYFIWDFGDGYTSTGQTVEHIYETIGDFNITLTQYLSSGEPVLSDPKTVTVRNLIPNLMEWDSSSYNSGSITASVKNTNPFVANVYNSWQQYDEDSFLHLYVENSKSIPFDITDKRIHLKPNWRFVDKDDNVIETIALKQDKIYAYKLNDEILFSTNEDDGDVFVGVSSQAEFFFIDDTPSGLDPDEIYLPSTIIVTQNLSGVYGDDKFTKEDYLQYPSLVNSVFVDNVVPEKLSITTNGVFEFGDIKYVDTKIPYNIRLTDNNGNFIKTSPFESDSVSSYMVEIGFVDENISTSSDPSFVGNSLQRFSPDFSNLGGFFESYFIPIQSTTDYISLSASSSLDYTINKTLTRYGIFSDENSNRIYRTSYVEGFNKTYIRKNSEVIGNEFDGFTSNKFSALVDTNYNAVFLDSDDSRIEIYDIAFDLLSSIQLSNYDDFILTQSVEIDIPLSSQVWGELSDPISGDQSDDSFGSSVAINTLGDIVVVGANEYDSVSSSFTGYAKVYKNINNNWVQLGNNLSSEDGSVDRFGWVVDINSGGDVVAIGSNNMSSSGKKYVKIFEYNGSDWVQLGNNIEETTTNFKGYGSTVSLNTSGNIIAVGSPDSTSGSVFDGIYGLVRVFEYNGSDWVQLGSTIDGSQISDKFGWSISLNGNGNILSISAPSGDGPSSESNTGNILTFEYNGSDWVQLGSTIYGETNSYLGRVVRLNKSGNILACVASTTIPYYISIYEYNGSDWVQLGDNIIDGASNSSGNNFLDINDAGDILILGGFTDNANTGRVVVYKYSEGNWGQVGSDIFGETADAEMGWGVSINGVGDLIAVGSPYDNNFGYVSTYNIVNTTETIVLSSFRGHPSPAQIQMDKEGNYFITLHETADLLYVIDNEVKKIDLYDQIAGDFVTLSGDAVVYEDDFGLSSYVYYDSDGGFLFQPAAFDILSDNETIYVAYTNESYNFVQKYKIDRTTDTFELSSLWICGLSSDVPVDMVSNRGGDRLYILTTNYYTRESSIREYNTYTDTLSTNSSVGYDAEFLTLDIDQNPWCASKSNLSSGIYNNLYKVVDGSVIFYSTNIFNTDIYIESFSLSAIGDSPDDDYAIAVNNSYIYNPQNRSIKSNPYVVTIDYNIYNDDVIRVDVFDGWQTGYRFEPWQITLNWNDGVSQTISGGDVNSGIKFSSSPTIPTDVELGITRDEYLNGGPWGESYYSNDDGEITIHRNDIIDNNTMDIGGLASDSYGNIWLLDSANDSMIIFNRDNPWQYETIIITEDLSITENRYVAYGDWNGFRWYNKFGYGGNTITYNLTGQSEPFRILPRNKYRLQKINEDFNATDTLKSYRTTELMLNYENLFDNFLGSIYGNNLDDGTYIGKNIYEKIANFVMNHGDIETCSIDALESFCEETGIEFETRITFPRDIKKLIDLFSIKFKKLWGDDYKTGFIEDYRGDELNTLTYNVSADPQVKFIAKEKFNNFYTIIDPLLIDSLSSYPLSSYEQSWGWGLSIPVNGDLQDYYEFYEMLPVDDQRWISVVDWENPLTDTTIEPISSFSDYMGENGIVSTVLGDKLRDGLGLYL